ncbi:MAG TPA: DUF4331 domain-containing protein, partial [Thermodesulfobacteriota bacterium]|nr:DUF4331 domain-containing protein [Thermodesulfobacteriota bacterium]
MGLSRVLTVFTYLLAVLSVSLAFNYTAALAANHREAPITAIDDEADITDVFAFVSYDPDDPSASDKVTMIVNYDPFLEPGNGPNYFPFDSEILYAIRVDNDQDALEDIVFEFRFTTEIRLPNVFTGFVGALDGINAPDNSPPDLDGNPTAGQPVIPPAITALDGDGSQGLSLRQFYSVTMVKGNNRTQLTSATGSPLFAVPTNVGPRTMPDYPSLFAQGIYDLGSGIKVFAGTIDDPFWLDLGATFDSINFRTQGFVVQGVLTDEQDADGSNNYAPDDFSGYNVNTIAIEVPIELLTSGGEKHAASDPEAVIGMWGTSSRPKEKKYRGPGEDPKLSKKFTQIQRMGNPLFNELVIGTGFKDKFSMAQPENDAEYSDFFLDPVFARVLNTVYEALYGPDVLPIPDVPRLDLLPLVQYTAPIAPEGTPTGPIADVLRLNTGIPPTPPDKQSRLGFLTLLDDDPSNDDPAGFPNGRRVVDDVTDIAARVVAGVLVPEFNNFPHNRIGDGVNVNDVQPYNTSFPYLNYAHDG